MPEQAMKPIPERDERLVRYLLADVSEEERASIEQEFLQDDQRYEELLALEDDLRCDYLRGELAPAHRSAFEKRFLSSAEDREKLERSLAVLEALDRAAPGRLEARPAAHPAWWLAAAAVLCAAVTGYWAVREVGRSRSRASATESEWAGRLSEEQGRGEALARALRGERERRAALEQELTRREQAAAPLRAVVALALAPGLVRGGEGRSVSLTSGVDRLRLSLRLPAGQDGPRFQASVRTAEGVELWFRGGLVVRDSSVVDVVVPARLLSAGAYEVALIAEAASGQAEEVADYHFEVTRR